ncbi:N-substituted formamide deformylase precursor [Planctomycetes bacterium K23_9]|uniref:N-substituted formamide deformylase n=2 Tax=Stieleria marina TaxID=1930275 RepID=A0A517NTI5_9BACT|nr:N-substituted formamide deformylase precursor [Planctomycetes bacterium K23_9]
MLLAADGIADTVFINGSIYSVDPELAWESSAAQAIAIDDDQILAIGTNAEILALANDQTRIQDLEGRMVLPGFHDVHTHILEAFSSVNTVQLSAATPLEDLVPLLTGQTPHVATGWVLGGGQTIDQFVGLTELPKDILDEAIPDVPAAMLEATSHSMWVNTAALTAAGITDSTPDPTGGVIVRDSVTGEATGLLIDNAVDLIFEVALAQNDQLDELNYQGLVQGIQTFNQFGVTSVADARVYPSRGHDDVWSRAETEEHLTVRANLGLWAYPQHDDVQQIADLTALYSNDEDRLLKINEIKLYSDGIIENGTAALLDAYDIAGYGGDHGLKYFEVERLENYLTALQEVGFAFNIHAVGDAGVRDALSAIESTNQGHTDLRHRITHAEIIHPDDYSRFASTGTIADFQVGGEILSPENREFLRTLVGDRADTLLPVRSLHDAGATVVFSSDFDVNSPNPFVGIEQSMTRTDGQELAHVKDAIEAYTYNAAYAMQQEDRVGSLTAGKLADLVVLDQNLLTIAPEDIDDTSVLLTLLGGETVHGNALQLAIGSSRILENGGSTTGTVTRPGTSGNLVVKLTSSDLSEATLPTTVTIPDGSSSVTFRIDSVNDDLDDGDRRVTLLAQAVDMIAAVAFATVVDEDPIGTDFGDAPTAEQSGFANDYPVTIAQDGAVHNVTSLFLGEAIDSEANGQPAFQATGDDVASQDDDDGATFATTFIIDTTTDTVANFSVVSSASGKLDAWFDFDRDGLWNHQTERVAEMVDVVAGVNTISIQLPQGTSVGETAARLRLSSAGGLTPLGFAADGEVEDEWINLRAGSQNLNARVTTSFNSAPTGPIIVATSEGRTSVRHQFTEFFDAPNSSFGGLSVFGDPQDETFVLDIATFALPARGLTLNGGTGENQLHVSGDGEVNLVEDSFRLANLKIIDLRDPGATTLIVSAASVQMLTPDSSVQILTGPGDRLQFADPTNWTFGDPIVQGDQFFHVAQSTVGNATEQIHVQTQLPWHNSIIPQDVDNSGQVTPNDILEVINQLVDRDYIEPDTQNGLPPGQLNPWPNRFYDTSGDNQFTPGDILEVINFLAEQRANTPSGEWIDDADLSVGPSDWIPVRKAADRQQRISRTTVHQSLASPRDAHLVLQSDLGQVAADSRDAGLFPDSTAPDSSTVSLDDKLATDLADTQLDTSRR